MSLTVKDILEKTFKKSFKGYDEDEVDKFLDQIIDEFKTLQNDNASLREALDAERERANRIRDTEETIMETLVSAQKSAKRILNEAGGKAQIIIESAEATSRKRSEQTIKELAESQRKLEEVKKSANLFASKFNGMMSGEMASFEKIYKAYFGGIEGGINVKALEKIDADITKSLNNMPEEVIAETKGEAGKEIHDEAPSGEVSKPQAEPEKLMEFTEINKALSEIEESGDTYRDEYEDVQDEEGGVRSEKKSGYDDYSWLYEYKTGEEDAGVTVKDPKEKAELESLIDDILE